ncbi:FAD-dependent oxidoreductase [Infirmifilum lucidum]|uniref:FAD-dependent oxidoreductase n=1 Tax=Infirmifilum lucidum TaxID=2776706 RepID=A0A7L9FIM8_9CREN|nr:FAD-dependent oxidoreductase [Infirmifilum lucidum]QOJ79212.1 FAD-dependent oxidoreductase [Infirmifilum lucidum]
MPNVLVVGGGITGVAVAYDLALRGARVTLVERGSLGAGTSGRTHGLLHSGCRYIADVEVARECYTENVILRRIAPFLFEKNGGLFVAISDDDLGYRDFFLKQCDKAGIPVQELSREEALRLEPNLNPGLKAVIRVPDGTFDPLKVILSFAASAKLHSAVIKPFNEVTGFKVEGGRVVSVRILDKTVPREYEVKPDFVVNATGAWADKVARLAGLRVPVKPSPGVMVALDGRIGNMVFNRLNKPGDGDIIVHHRGTSVVGTTSWVVEDPDKVAPPREHIELMIRRGSELAPVVSRLRVKAVYVSSRPLVGEGAASSGREVSRSFAVIDHSREGVENFVSIIGGKFTTARLMAEKLGDFVSERLGIARESSTASTPLAPYWLFFEG